MTTDWNIPGWVVNYLVEVRGGDLAKVGYVPSGQAAGTLLGRLLLMEPTHRFGEKRMLLLYFVISVGLQIVFWLVPNIIAGATALSIMGFFQGPFFATVSIDAGVCENERHRTGKSLMMLRRRGFQSHRNFSRGKSNQQLSVREFTQLNTHALSVHIECQLGLPTHCQQVSYL